MHQKEISIKYENANNFEEVTMTEHICCMIRRTMRWLRWHIVDPCTMLVRMRMCDGPEHAIILLLIEGFLLCAFFAIYNYAPEANASNRLNSFAPYLNGQSSSISVTYTRKFYIDAAISLFPLFSSFFLIICFFCPSTHLSYVLPFSYVPGEEHFSK